MFENYDFSDFLGIFFLAIPIFIFIFLTIFEGLISLFATIFPRRERPKVVLHYHYRDKS